MRKRIVSVMGVMGIAFLCSTAFAQLQEGVMLKADGEVIDVVQGHCVPCVTDWNDDGKKDLITGSFRGGKILLYLNHGTDAAPELKFAGNLHAGGAEISLPSG